MIYFFDSSVLIEILKGNAQIIQRYIGNPLVTINLAYGEVYYYCLKAHLALEHFRHLTFQLLSYTLADIEAAMELLYQRKQITGDFSFIDAVVYVIAKKNNCIFVTKNFGFKGLDNVEFISTS